MHALVLYREFLFIFLIYWLDWLEKSRVDIWDLVNMVCWSQPKTCHYCDNELFLPVHPRPVCVVHLTPLTPSLHMSMCGAIELLTPAFI